MTSTMKVLIITWMIIGFAIVGGVGFYIGRMTAQRPASQPFPMQGQFQGQQYPTGTMRQQPQGGEQQPSGGGPQQQQPFQQR